MNDSIMPIMPAIQPLIGRSGAASVPQTKMPKTQSQKYSAEVN